MKKILFIAAALAASAACTKTTTVYDDSKNEIGLSPVTHISTKTGPVEGTTYPEGETFGVFAQHTTAAAGEIFSSGSGDLKEYLKGVEFEKNGENPEWHGTTPYYWPKTGSLYFAGYSPYNATGTKSYSFVRATPSLTITDFIQGTYDSEPVSNQMVDLMWFDVTTNSANTGAPAVTFNHALSWLTFNLKCESSKLNDLFSIKSVILKNINNTGTFTSNGSKTDATWSSSAPAEIVLFSGTQSITETAHTIDDILIIPQDTQQIEIIYTQKAAAGTSEIEQSFTLKLKGGETASSDSEPWLLGKHYTYNITFSAEEIKLTPGVTDWENVTGGDITIQ